ncbi:hypothetical protein [Plebeiibacterium marinum]|uniref:Uncharacterized protein n=1 Tax=Plebeiibacterium marinum TaxID=2992111 RepID=A0AAE3SLZ7_9BACT|nr:hypothetical protein [Plebeiobacterium marinum]MCW3807954.1 hypothetical protein [Plebeiobacterium marinum]
MNFDLSVSPGITFEDEHPSELHPAIHLECAYSFPLGNFHIGPVVSLGAHDEKQHWHRFTFGLWFLT